MTPTGRTSPTNARRAGLAAAARADVLLIPGASSLPRLREDVAGAAVPLSDGDIAELDQVGHPLR